MNLAARSHPPAERLRAFRLGLLDEGEQQTIGAHLADCSACCDIVEQRDDVIFARLRGAGWDPEVTRPNLRTPSDRADARPREGAAESPDYAELLSPPQTAGELGRLGRYRVLKLLGHGGMGAVFVAEDTLLHRQVALKVMLPDSARRADAQERFLREARAVAAIEHDHVVAILDIGQERGVFYLAMPLLRGVSLEERLSAGAPLSWPQIVRIAREMAEGLAAAHAKGLIHRDVKPGNLWLEAPRADDAADDFARVKLLDFGLVTQHTAKPGLTGSGFVVGTPSYMAPEQARGEGIDARADLFSVGVVLYRLCTGRLPFSGQSALSVLTALATEVPPPPRTVNPAVPAELSNLITALMEKDPQRRPASARDLAERLQRLETTLAAAAPARGTPGLPAWRRRRRAAALAALGMFVPLLLWLAAVLFSNESRDDSAAGSAGLDPKGTPMRGGGPSPGDALTSAEWQWSKPQNLGPLVNAPGLNAAPTLSGDALRLVFVSDRGGRQRLWESQRRSAADSFGAPRAIEAAGLETLTQFWDPCLAADGRTLYVLASDNPKGAGLLALHRTTVEQPWGKAVPAGEQWGVPAGTFAPRLSADSCVLVCCGRRLGRPGSSALWVSRRASADVPFGEPVLLGPDINTSQRESILALSADGCTLLFLRGLEFRELWMATRSSTTEPFRSPVPVDFPFEHSFTPHPGGLSADGRTLVFTSVQPGGTGSDLWLSRRVPVPPGQPRTPPFARAPFDEAQARVSQEAWAKYLGVPVEYPNPVGMRFRLVPPGSYSPHPKMYRGPKPVSNLVVEPFYMGVHEVTVGQFRRFVEETKYVTVAEKDGKGGYRAGGKFAESGTLPIYTWRLPDFAPGPDCPVTVVHWKDAEAFCRWLGTKDGREYRLPTEAEWHWAARAGSAALYFFGDDPALLKEYGWFDINSEGKSQPVGRKKANPWGLFDVYGNVLELCREWASPDHSQRRTVVDHPDGPAANEWLISFGGNYAEGTFFAGGVGYCGPASHLGFRVYLTCKRPAR